MLRLLADVEGVRRLHLHPVGQLEGLDARLELRLASDPVAVAGQYIRDNFDANESAPVEIVIPGGAGKADARQPRRVLVRRGLHHGIDPLRAERGGQRLVDGAVDDESLDELGRLLSTLGVEVAGRMLMSKRSVHSGTYLGKGKLEELQRLMDAHLAHAAIIDVDLSPNQLRNLEKEVEAGSFVTWLGPPNDIHSQQGIDGDAMELVLFGKNVTVIPRNYYDPETGQVRTALPQ